MKKKLNVPLNGLKLIPTSDIIKSMERVAKKIEQELDEEKREVKNMFADENKVKMD